jgi:hypothetical protein
MEIFVKPSPRRVDPRKPESHPEYEHIRKVGHGNVDAFRKQFESEAQWNDYKKQVNSNPNNVLGLPAFYPPDIPKLFLRMIEFNANPIEVFNEQVRLDGIREVEIFCHICDKLTQHSISPHECFCKKCGDYKPYRTGGLS